MKAPLVIVGAQAWKSEDELKLLYDENVRSLFARSKVIQLSYAPFSLLVSLIKGAKGTIFTSLYEGFGLPVLESMLLGTPVKHAGRDEHPPVTLVIEEEREESEPETEEEQAHRIPLEKIVPAEYKRDDAHRQEGTGWV